ncbi:TPA: hypothetical protein JD339_18795 [Citrobacter freundii]|nr:hypothetical protein C3404_21010 [Citrobacter freundii complex sp. CFNIH11]QAT68710.1 hypothetical protein EQ249_03345 [Citrobacter freundii]THE47083.1 hypothetical protein DJ483_08885 [Citrobacter freundii]HAU5699016.1 hypothetical protein [Citrobacter freundii]
MLAPISGKFILWLHSFFESHHNHGIPLFPFTRRRLNYNSSDHITIILHTGHLYELSVAVRPARFRLHHA